MRLGVTTKHLELRCRKRAHTAGDDDSAELLQPCERKIPLVHEVEKDPALEQPRGDVAQRFLVRLVEAAEKLLAKRDHADRSPYVSVAIEIRVLFEESAPGPHGARRVPSQTHLETASSAKLG